MATSACRFFALITLLSSMAKPFEQKRSSKDNGSVSCPQILRKETTDAAYSNKTADSSALGECTCETQDEMLCPNFSSVPFKFSYVGYSKELMLSGENMKKDFDTVAQHVALFLNDVDVYSLTLNRFCGEGVEYDAISDREFTSIRDDLLSVLNFTRFHGADSVIRLDLSSNCGGIIVGNFRNSFNNLVELDMSGNLFKTIPEGAFEGLSKLESLKLDMNRIENVTRGSFKGLTSLTTLSMFSNYLETLTEDMFGELPNLEFLQLRSNRIATVSSNAFNKNTQMIDLILARNLIHDLPSDVFRSLTKLTHLSIYECRLRSIPDGLLNGLVKLEAALFYNNNLSHIPPNTFSTNLMLKEVELSGNKFVDLPFVRLGAFGMQGPASFRLRNNGMTNLEIPLEKRVKVARQLDLSRNCFTNITEVETSSRELATSRIVDFICENCCLHSISRKLLQNVTSLVNFGHNHIQSLHMNMLTNIAHLNSIELSHNLIKSVKTTWEYPLVQNESYAPYDNPVTRIVLHFNPIVCDCHLLPFLKIVANQAEPPEGLRRSLMSFDVANTFCEEPKSLRGQRLGQILHKKNLASKLVCSVKTGCPESCECYLLAIDDVVVVNCTGRGIKEFPRLADIGQPQSVRLENNGLRNIPERTSSDWYMIKELFLENNSLTSLDNLSITPNLTLLHLNNNRLSQFPQQLQSFFNNNYNNVSLTLSGNPWECNCQLQKLKAWIYSKGNVADFKKMECIFPGTNTKVFLANATDVELCPELSNNQQLLIKILIPTIAALAVAASIAITLIHRFKPEIQLWLFTHGYCLTLVTEEDVDADKRYDAFVSYSTKDEEWVGTQLVPGLEKGIPSYSLCIHNRDWLAGEWIPEQILKSVQQSRRTIIVLTQNFIESDWSRLEFRAAYRQALTDQVNRVLVLIPGDSLPDLRKLDSELKAFIRLNTYIKWTDANFWRKLRCAMPRTKMSVKRKDVTKSRWQSKRICSAERSM